MKKIYIGVHACAEYGDGPGYAQIPASTDFCEKLKSLASLCKENKLNKLYELHTSDDVERYGPGNIADELRLQGSHLVVTDHSFWFTSQPKHSDYMVETSIVEIDDFIAAVMAEGDEPVYLLSTLQTLQNWFPNIVFKDESCTFIDDEENKYIYVDVNGASISNPYISSCGRFLAEPGDYGIPEDVAETMMDINTARMYKYSLLAAEELAQSFDGYLSPCSERGHTMLYEGEVVGVTSCHFVQRLSGKTAAIHSMADIERAASDEGALVEVGDDLAVKYESGVVTITKKPADRLYLANITEQNGERRYEHAIVLRTAGNPVAALDQLAREELYGDKPDDDDDDYRDGGYYFNGGCYYLKANPESIRPLTEDQFKVIQGIVPDFTVLPNEPEPDTSPRPRMH